MGWIGIRVKKNQGGSGGVSPPAFVAPQGIFFLSHGSSLRKTLDLRAFSRAFWKRFWLPNRYGEIFIAFGFAQCASWRAVLRVFARFCAFPGQKYAKKAVFGPFFMVFKTFSAYVY